MAIFLRTSGVDNNDAGTSEFVGIPRPVGVQDGDLVVAFIAVDSADVDITPPDDTWTKAFRTDPSQAISAAVYWKIALNERDRWVFALSDDVDAQGAVAVYGGADAWEPVEAVFAGATSADTAQAVAASSTSVDDEELVLFVATDVADDIDPPSGYAEAQERQNGGTVSLSRLAVPSASASIPATAATSGTAADGASLLVVIRPGAGTLSVDEIRKLIVGGLPTDADRIYDLTPTGDFYKLFQAIALTAKQVVFDLVDLLRLEISPRFARYKLPDWERVFGLTTTRAAQLGTIAQRQAQVISRWREAAGLGSTRDAITAIIGPLLGYDEPTEVQVVTTDRELLRIEHSYTGDLLSIPAGDPAMFEFDTVDGGKVSSGGARVQLEYGSGSGDFAVTLEAPDGTTKTWQVTLDGQALDILFGPTLAGAQMMGTWTLTVQNDTGGTLEVIPTVFVEGVQVDHLADRQLTAAAMFDWGIYADPDHIGENGNPADFAAVRAALGRTAFAHTTGNLLQSLEPYPDEDAGVHAAIPDECIPT